MKTVYMDTSYLVAILDPREQWHELAKSVSKSLGPVRLATSEFVLIEVLNTFAEKGPLFRAKTSDYIDLIRANANCRCSPLTSDHFYRSFNLYKQRADKNWSLVDCASMIDMQDLG